MTITHHVNKTRCDFSLVVFFVANLISVFGVIAVFSPSMLNMLIGANNSMIFIQHPMLAVVVLMLGLALELVSVLLKPSCKSTESLSAATQAFAQGNHLQVKSDPVAEMVDWSPATQGNVNFVATKLIDCGNGIIQVSTQRKALLLIGLFIVLGLMPLAMALSAGSVIGDVVTLASVLIGAGVVAVAIKMLYAAKRPMVFNRQLGYMRPGYHGGCANKKQFKTMPLSNIHALQILSEQDQKNRNADSHNSKASRYGASYELNLILKDHSRMNVIDHGCPKAVAKDAAKLADFLNIPVWSRI